jgi:hypothetical protein
MRIPIRTSDIPISVETEYETPNSVNAETLQKIFNTVTKVVHSFGHDQIELYDVYVDTIQCKGLDITRTNIDIPVTPYTIEFLKELRDHYLDTKILGIDIQKIQSSVDYVRLAIMVSEFPGHLRDIYTEYSKRHVYIQRQSKHTILPFYFGGYSPKGMMYMTCTERPPDTRITDVIPKKFLSSDPPLSGWSGGRPIHSEVWTKLHDLTRRVLRAGFWIPGPLHRVRFRTHANGVSRPIVTRTGYLYRIPRSIANDVASRLDRGESLPSIMYHTALLPWVYQLMRENPYYPSISVLDLLERLAAHVTPKTREIETFLKDLVTYPTTPLTVTPTLLPQTSTANTISIQSIFDAMGIKQDRVSELASGQYGTTYRIAVSKGIVKSMLRFTEQMSHVTLHTPPPSNRKYLVLKFQKLNPKNTDAVKDVVREARMHMKVSSSSVLGKSWLRKKEYRGWDVAPVFYFAGVYRGYSIMCMEYIKGVPLVTYLKKGSVPKTVFKSLEQAIETMLRLGVVHADMHGKNIYVMPGGQVKILDFGFAFEIPPRVHTSVVKILNSSKSIEKAWVESGLQNVVDARFHAYPYFHSNMKMLQFVAMFAK